MRRRCNSLRVCPVYLVNLVLLVCLVEEVPLVCLVHLVEEVHLVYLVGIGLTKQTEQTRETE
jgi:hypothetical protein